MGYSSPLVHLKRKSKEEILKQAIGNFFADTCPTCRERDSKKEVLLRIAGKDGLPLCDCVSMMDCAKKLFGDKAK